jgi:hypothetical protein
MEKKNAENNDSGVFMCIIEKNTRTNDSGVFICKWKKNAKTIVPAFLCI